MIFVKQMTIIRGHPLQLVASFYRSQIILGCMLSSLAIQQTWVEEVKIGGSLSRVGVSYEII